MTTTQKLIEDIVRETHMEWLEKAEHADISNRRMTVLPYGFLSPAVRRSVQKALANILEAEIENVKGFRFSVPMGEGKFTALCCPDCKDQRYICKSCYITHLQSLLELLK